MTGIGELFTEGALVKTILDVTNGFAYIQNADTNAYLEGRFGELLSLRGNSVFNCTATNGALSTLMPFENILVTTGHKIKLGDILISADGFIYRIIDIRDVTNKAELSYVGNLNGGSGGGGSDYVSYFPQTLTADQQEQARKNIGALKVPRGIARELFFFGEYDDFQDSGSRKVYKIAGKQDWLNSLDDFDFRVRFAVRINIGTIEEYEFTKADCTIDPTVQGKKYWSFFAATSQGGLTHVLTVANGLSVVGFESEDYCSFAYPSELENYTVEFFKLSETEQELKVVTSVNGVQADENGNVKINVGGGSGGEDGFSPVAKVTQTGTGAVISITDKSGTTTATLANGKDGEPGKDGSARVLLWSNQHPRSFGAESVPLDLSGYDGIEVLFYEYDDNVDNAIISSGYIPLDFQYKSDGSAYPLYGQGTLTRGFATYYRCFYVNPTGIDFEVANAVDDGNPSLESSYIIPYRIYGFKNCVFDGGVWTPDEHINALIDAKLGVIENGSY